MKSICFTAGRTYVQRPGLWRKSLRSNRERRAGTKAALATGPTDDSLGNPSQRGLGASQMSFCVDLSHVPFYRSHRNGNEGDPEGRAALQSAPPTTQLLAEWETATSLLQTNNVGFLARNNSLNKEKKKLLLFIVFVTASSCN